MLAIGPLARVVAGDTPLVRPPGGQDEARFIGACIRCDRCRSACPNDAIGVANVGEGLLNARTPKMDFRKGFCDFCMNAGNPHGAVGRVDKATGMIIGEDGLGTSDTGLLCSLNCPTGALLPFEHTREWVGLAVILPEECIAYRVYGGCRVCVDKCPFRAVTLDADSRPVVDPTKCSGCGNCEFACPSHTYRTFTGTSKRGINIELIDGQRPVAEKTQTDDSDSSQTGDSDSSRTSDSDSSRTGGNSADSGVREQTSEGQTNVGPGNNWGGRAG
jgi:ferredoxin-type protein NapG